MDTIENLRRQIDTAEQLHSVVKTLKALAAVNIRQMELAVESLRHYESTVQMGFQVLFRNRADVLAMAKSCRKQKLGIVVFGSDQGMCGKLNDQIVSYAISAPGMADASTGNQVILAVGSRTSDLLADAGWRVEQTMRAPNSISGITPLVIEVLLAIEHWHTELRIDQVKLFFHEHQSRTASQPVCTQLLPIDLEWLLRLQQRKWPNKTLPTFSMSQDRLFTRLVREYLFVSLYRAEAESLASENASRLKSMQSAEKNTEERIAELTRRFHLTRQMTTTEELLDIASGFEALSNQAS